MNTTMEPQQRLVNVGALSLGTFLLIAHAAVTIGRERREETGRVIERGMACRHIPGLALAVVKDGKVMLSEGYGVKDLDTRERVTPDTKFLIASLTKAFTASLLTNVMAKRNKKMSTNVKYTLEGGFKFNNSLRSVYATLEDLLAHRMGIPRNSFVRLATDFSIQSFARKIRYLPHKGGFRDSFYYSDLMYGLSAYITEEQQGHKPWKQQIRDTIFTPLGMHNSTFVDDVDFNSDDVATPYVRENNRMVEASVDFIKHWGRNLGSGNIMSSANDMAQWMLMLLNDGNDTQGRRVLREGVVEDTFNPQNFIRPSYAYKYRKPNSPYSFTADNYALGWRLGYYKGYRMIYHSGSSFGYRSFLTLLPDMNVSVVTLMTGVDDEYRFRTALHMYLMDQALGHDPWIDVNSICTYPDQQKSPAAGNKRSVDKLNTGDETPQLVDEDDEEYSDMTRIPQGRVARAAASFPEKEYTGSYRHLAYGTLNVRYNETAQSLMLEYGIGLWRLTPVGGHDFDGEWLKDPPTIRLNVKFKTKGNATYAVEATSFERKMPPRFMKIA